MTKAYKHMHSVETNLARRWTKEFGYSPHKIAKLLGRCPKTVRSNLVAKPAGARGVGRPKMTEADYKKCEKALEVLLKKANAEEEVTAAMVKEKAGVPYCEKVIRTAFKKHGKPFRKLREKPILTEEDVEKRFKFVKKHAQHEKSRWVKMPHAVIDNKKFSLYLDRKARRYAAQRTVRGAYRDGKNAVKPYLVKPKATLKYPVKGAIVTAGVINGRIRFWHVVKGRWNANKAVHMYAELDKVLCKSFPALATKANAKWVILEDNDPAGYKATAAVAEKRKLGMKVMELPPRSPDLNCLDYSLWSRINKKLRAQEKAFPPQKKETKDECLKRLRSAALGLPTAVVKDAQMSMKRRCTEIRAAKGGLIEE
jgi:transposase